MARKAGGKATIGQNLVHNAYRDMLAEVASSPAQSDEHGRLIKKRRVAGRIVTQTPQERPSQQYSTSVQPIKDQNLDHLFEDVPDTQRPLQEAEQTESEDSADSDVNWEQVDLKQSDDGDDVAGSEVSDEPKGLDLVLQNEKQRASRPTVDRRKPITAAEKKLRLVVHKVNVSALLAHVHIRNHWCNDTNVHAILRKLLTKKMVSYLTHDVNATQFQQSRSFMDGLQQASDVFHTHFKISARGMSKPNWAHPKLVQHMHIPDDIDLPMQKEDFIQAAKSLTASRDVGAQLFCALLRSAGVDARLVCSLQALPFGAVEKSSTPQQKYAMVVDEPASRRTTPESDSENSKIRHPSPALIGSRGGQSRFATNQTSSQSNGQLTLLLLFVTLYPLQCHDLISSSSPPKRRIRESPNPVYWTEAFSPSIQKWLPVDPLTTNTIAKPSKLCPSSSSTTPLTYAVAFEEDLSAHDVTRRYSRVYNAKTIKDRVESTTNGRAWFKRLMRMFRRPHGEKLDRDQLEQAELSQKEAQEPMPRGVQDFKDHPYYALERHLKRHEVIHPRREVGKVGGAGKGHDKQSLEVVYRRRDVVMVLSADKWYRAHGRVIKPKEQPLKRVTARKKTRRGSSEDDDDDDEQRLGTPLYAITQTQLYEPQPVTEDDRIPKNAYGNLDIYHAHMIPPGAAHVQHPDTARVARLLGIDYADAVTGFSFKGRHGTAVVNGAVVCAAHVDAVRSVIEGVEEEKADLELEARSQRAVALWGRLMRGLRVRERIEGYAGGDGEGIIAQEDGLEEDDHDDDDDEGGGFLPDRNEIRGSAEPTAPSAPTIERPSVPPGDSLSHLPSLQSPPTPIRITYGPPLPSTSPPPPSPQTTTIPHHQRDLFHDTTSDDAGGGGGGFLIEDSTEADHDNAGGFTVVESSTADHDNNTGGGVLPNNDEEGDDDDATMDDEKAEEEALQAAIARSVLESHAVPRDDFGEGPSGTRNTTAVRGAGEVTGVTDIKMEIEEGGGSRGVHEGDGDNKEEMEGEEGSDIGSLMSHDPDDEEEEVMEL